MSLSIDRNPSPPPEILEEDENFVPDRVGSTLYSKRWLYKTLMTMLKVVGDYPPPENSVNENGSSETEVVNPVPIITELDAKIEEDACTLWDMSANLEVAQFLCECDVAEIFLSIIEHTKSPRLLEIVVGILGNMSSFTATCEYISSNSTLVYALIMLSGCSDSCTLVQLFRLLTCGVVKETCQLEWFKAFKENPFFMENVKSILENNLCRDVLCGILEFLYQLFNYDIVSLTLPWGEEPYTLAIIECGKELLKCNHNEDLDIFFSATYALCQQSKNMSVYGEHFEAMRPIFHAYFSKLGEEENLPQFSRLKAVINAFAMYGDLIFSGHVLPAHIQCDEDASKGMLNICKMVTTFLRNYTEENTHKKSIEDVSSVTMSEDRNGNSTSNEEDVIESWKTLLDAIVYAAKSCVPYAKQENEKCILVEIVRFHLFTED